MTHPSATSLRGAATVFVVQDTYGQPTFYAGVEREGVAIHFQAASKTTRPPGQGAVNFFVTKCFGMESKQPQTTP